MGISCGRVLLSAAVIVAAGAGHGAEIGIVSTGGGSAIVLVAGPIETGDRERLAATVAGRSDVLVVFDSPGGLVSEGIALGSLIRMRDFATGVAAGDDCLSACALAWLGGRIRSIQDGGRVGFHAAYRLDPAGVATESGAANAVIGAYLTNLGLPLDTVYWVTQSAPDQMAYLTPDVARSIGLEYIPVPQSNAVPSASGGASPARDGGAEALVNPAAAASEFVDRHFAASRLAGNTDYVRAVYDDTVLYFGEWLPRAEITRRRAAYFERWPAGRTWRTDTPTMTCTAASCVIEGSARYIATAEVRNTRSEGSFRYRFDVTIRNDAVRIEREENSTVSRDVVVIDETRLTAIQMAQRELDRHGCDPGPADGSWGGRSAAALARFSAAASPGLDRRAPDATTLATLRRTPAPACGRARTTKSRVR